MRSVLVAFAILLAILLAISALGGSLNLTEKFYEDAMEEDAEAFYEEETAKEEAENFEETEPPKAPVAPVESTGPSAPTAPTAMPQTTETKEEFYVEDEETVEPFEDDNTYMPY